MNVLATPAPKDRFLGTLQLLDLTGILLRLVVEDAGLPWLLRFWSGSRDTSGVVPFQGDFTRGPDCVEVGESTQIELLLDGERSSFAVNFSPSLARETGLLVTV